MDFYGFNRAPTVDQLPRFIGPSAFHQRSYHIFRGYHDATASGLERLPVPFEDHP